MVILFFMRWDMIPSTTNKATDKNDWQVYAYRIESMYVAWSRSRRRKQVKQLVISRMYTSVCRSRNSTQLQGLKSDHCYDAKLRICPGYDRFSRWRGLLRGDWGGLWAEEIVWNIYENTFRFHVLYVRINKRMGM